MNDESNVIDEITIEKFKHFINSNFNELQITNILSMLQLYIELVWRDEMHKRVYTKKTDDLMETKLRWVAEFADVFNNFLKNSWQNK